MQTIPASEFKARCLALLDEVNRTGEVLTILKRGRPVARLIPARKTAGKGRYPQDEIRGTVHVLGDIVSPAVPRERWEATKHGR